MADITHQHTYNVDVDTGSIKQPGGVLIGMGDDAADVFTVALSKSGTACSDLEGGTGYFQRPDGTTVLIEGTVTGNRIIVELPAECYVYAGACKLTVKAQTTVGDGADVTVAIIEGRVLITRTSATSDPGSIWQVDDLWNALNSKVDEPASEGTSGQALLTDGNGNRYWGSAQSASAAGSVIVDGATYSLRTGTAGAAGYLTLVPES